MHSKLNSTSKGSLLAWFDSMNPSYLNKIISSTQKTLDFFCIIMTKVYFGPLHYLDLSVTVLRQHALLCWVVMDNAPKKHDNKQVMIYSVS